MEDKLLRLWVVGGRRLQAANEGAVAKLSLGVRANDLKVPGGVKPTDLLLQGALQGQCNKNIGILDIEANCKVRNTSPVR